MPLTRRIGSRSLLILLAGITVESRLDAQALNVDALCAAADQAVEHIALPPAGDLPWMRWYTLTGCGPQGVRAAAAALRTNELRQETDDRKLGEFFQLFGGFRSNVLLNSLQDAAEDNGASVPIRLYAIEAMTAYLYPAMTMSRAALGNVAPEGRCISGPRAAYNPGSFDDLPNGVFDRVLNSLTRVANKAGAAPTVQRLATCWKDLLELTVPATTGKIDVTYVCGNTFKVHNGNAADVNLHYAVLQTPDAGGLSLLGGEDRVFNMLYAGTLQVSYNGQVIATKVNGNKKCP